MSDADDNAQGAGGPPRWSTTEERWAAVELNIQMAIQRGEFDNLPGAGKPIEGLDRTHDPDWWIRQKIQNENITGIAPPVFQLRNEDSNLHTVLDSFSREAEVRQHLEGFNSRIRAARMQLMGGPPVITPLRDIDSEVEAWHERRAVTPPAATPPKPTPKTRWWQRDVV